MADEIRTKRLLLRRATYEDAVAMHCIMTNPAAMRYWSNPPHKQIEETERWMASMVEADPADSDDFIVTLDGVLIGKLGTWKIPEIGFLIDPEHWGNGYASEATFSPSSEPRRPAYSSRRSTSARRKSTEPRSASFATVGQSFTGGWSRTSRSELQPIVDTVAKLVPDLPRSLRSPGLHETVTGKKHD